MWASWFSGGARREEELPRPYYHNNGKYTSGRHSSGGGSVHGQYGDAMGEYEFYEPVEPAYESELQRTPRVCLADTYMNYIASCLTSPIRTRLSLTAS